MEIVIQAWLAAAAVCSTASDDTGLGRYRFAQVQMGVQFEIQLYASDEKSANLAARQAFRRVEQLNNHFSDYDPTSELSRLSKTAGSGARVDLSDELWQVLSLSDRLARRTDGAFDVTVGPYVRLWRRARRQREMPSEARLTEARKAVGHSHLRLGPTDRSALLTQPGMKLDLGGIAKGYAADEALAVLGRHGITRALVDAGGDIRVGDPPPGKTGWRIGIARLAAEAPPVRFLRLANTAVATSGDAWQYVEIDGRRYSHIVDPRTGLGLTRRSSVTVLAPDCTTADSLATAISVLGPKHGIALADETDGVACLIVQQIDGKPRMTRSRRFKTIETDAAAVEAATCVAAE